MTEDIMKSQKSFINFSVFSYWHDRRCSAKSTELKNINSYFLSYVEGKINKSINFNIYILNNEQLLNNQILYIEYTDILLHSDNSKSVSDMSRNVAVYYIVFLHIMLIIFFCFYSFFYLTSVFPSTTFAKIIHQVTSYQEPINAFSDDKLLDSKSD